MMKDDATISAFFRRYKSKLFLIFFSLLMAFSFFAEAGVQIEATRIIYNADSRSASLSINNDSDDPYMVQSWLDNGDKEAMNKSIPVVVTPPILKLAGQKEAILRFIYSGKGLAADRESLLWVNVQEIPPAPREDNVLQVAIRTRLKLFYRPASIKDTLQHEAARLQWRRSGNSLRLVNNSPYHITLSAVTLGTADSKRVKLSEDMVKPFGELSLPVPQGSLNVKKLSFTYINDYGGHTEIKDVDIN